MALTQMLCSSVMDRCDRGSSKQRGSFDIVSEGSCASYYCSADAEAAVLGRRSHCVHDAKDCGWPLEAKWMRTKAGS